MIKPSIGQLIEKTSKVEENGEKEPIFNKYSLAMATAKVAKIITNDTLKNVKVKKQTQTSSQRAKEKDRYQEERAVTNAVIDIMNDKYEFVMPGEAGYDSAIVEVPIFKAEEPPKERYDRYEDTKELMGADEIVDDGEVSENFIDLEEMEK